MIATGNYIFKDIFPISAPPEQDVNAAIFLESITNIESHI